MAGLFEKRQEQAAEVILQVLQLLNAAGYSCILTNSYEWDDAKVKVKSMAMGRLKSISDRWGQIADMLSHAKKTKGHAFLSNSGESQMVLSGTVEIIAVKDEVASRRRFHYVGKTVVLGNKSNETVQAALARSPFRIEAEEYGHQLAEATEASIAISECVQRVSPLEVVHLLFGRHFHSLGIS